jgi:hypothetical protein
MGTAPFNNVFAFFFSCFPVARSLFTKGVRAEEVGHVYSFVAVIAIVGPASGDIIFRKVCNCN